MNRFNIKKIVQRAFDATSDLTYEVQIIQRNLDGYIPGETASDDLMIHSAKYLKVKEFGGFSNLEKRPVFQENPIIGWLWCEVGVPLSGDELKIEDQLSRIVQVRSLDHGAGCFYEVWTE